jgi:hypothetical protein
MPLWHNLGPALPIFAVCMLGSTLLCLCLTSCSDPGFIPRSPQRGPQGGEPRQRRVETTIGAQVFTWCKTCHIWRPPKAHHCSECGHCVLGYDHHCPFVNNCVGVRNHFYFLSFLGGVVGLGTTVLAGTVLGLQYLVVPGLGPPNPEVPEPEPEPEPGDTTKTTSTTIVLLMAVPVSILTVILLGFLAFHTYLSCSLQTTKTVMRAHREGRGADRPVRKLHSPIVTCPRMYCG